MRHLGSILSNSEASLINVKTQLLQFVKTGLSESQGPSIVGENASGIVGQDPTYMVGRRSIRHWGWKDERVRKGLESFEIQLNPDSSKSGNCM
jgi:hypothetical protein